MKDASNYYRWQRDVLASHLGQRVLEIGCGVGGFTHALLGRERVVSVDLSSEMLEALGRSLASQPEWTGIVADVTGESFAELVAPHRCNSITALNVIEHIEDDLAALATLREILPRGGTAAVLVPANRWLYSSFDAAVGHHRRYTRASLQEKLRRAGFRVDRTLYFNAIGAIGWYLNYRLLGIDHVNRGTTTQIGLFDRYIVPTAQRLERLVPPPFGLSVIGLATVP